MDGRYKFLLWVVCVCLMLLPTGSPAHTERLQSPGEYARALPMVHGHDDGVGLGIQESSSTYLRSSSQGVCKEILTFEQILFEEQVMSIAKILKFEEGFSLKPYLCSEDYVTIGYGTKIHKQKGLNPDDFTIRISKSTAIAWLQRDLDKTRHQIYHGKFGYIYKRQNVAVQTILLSMSYQMGYEGILKFKKMWANLDAYNYEGAEREALDSLWAKQTPDRAKRHAAVLRLNSFMPYQSLVDFNE